MVPDDVEKPSCCLKFGFCGQRCTRERSGSHPFLRELSRMNPNGMLTQFAWKDIDFGDERPLFRNKSWWSGIEEARPETAGGHQRQPCHMHLRGSRSD